MLRLFSAKTVQEKDVSDNSSEYDSDSEENDKQFNVFQKPLCVQQWGENIMVSYYFLSIRDVAPHLSSWCFNRKMDDKHKENIKKDLLSKSNPHLMGSIQVIRDKKLNCRIINGQHRLSVIQEIIKEDIDFNFQMNLMFEVYDCNIEDIDDVSDAEMHKNIESIFKIANNSLNLKPEQDHDILCKQIVIAMMKDPLLKRGIVDKTVGDVNKPKISAKLLFELLKSLLQSDKIDMSVPEIITRIKKINANISTTPFIKLFGRHNPAQSKQKQFEKAKELGFYLNLSSRMTPDVWIEMISEPF